MREVVDLVRGFEPETELERRVASDPELIAGLAWGDPRPGHPEGTVAAHVGDLLARIDEAECADGDRRRLRLIALLHDSFKYRVQDWRPKAGRNHHAARARRFAERFTDDPGVLSTLEHHDRPYALWRKMRRRGTLDERGFERMIGEVADPELFLCFVELDGSTDGKRPEPVVWFRQELQRRDIVS